MNRNRLNFYVDVLMTICMTITIFIGVLPGFFRHGDHEDGEHDIIEGQTDGKLRKQL